MGTNAWRPDEAGAYSGCVRVCRGTDADSPYRASGPIFVRQDATTAGPEPGVVPALLTHRLLSLRAYDDDAMMRNATTARGVDAADAITTMFADARIHTIHVHNAETGCYLAKVVRPRY